MSETNRNVFLREDPPVFIRGDIKSEEVITQNRGDAPEKKNFSGGVPLLTADPFPLATKIKHIREILKKELDGFENSNDRTKLFILTYIADETARILFSDMRKMEKFTVGKMKAYLRYQNKELGTKVVRW